MIDTATSPDMILRMNTEEVAAFMSDLMREHRLSQLVRDLNALVLDQGPQSKAGQVLKHMGFLV